MYIYTHTPIFSVSVYFLYIRKTTLKILYTHLQIQYKSPVSYNHMLCLQNQSYIIYFCKNTKIVKEIPKLYTEQPYCDFQMLIQQTRVLNF